MRSRTMLLTATLLVLLGGCATTENFRATMNHFIGQPIDEARLAFGYNYREHKLEDGRRAFTWVTAERRSTPGYRDPLLVQTEEIDGKRQIVAISPGSYMPPERYTVSCEFTFITARNGLIETWRAHGNGCRSAGVVPPVMRPGG